MMHTTVGVGVRDTQEHTVTRSACMHVGEREGIVHKSPPLWSEIINTPQLWMNPSLADPLLLCFCPPCACAHQRVSFELSIQHALNAAPPPVDKAAALRKAVCLAAGERVLGRCVRARQVALLCFGGEVAKPGGM